MELLPVFSGDELHAIQEKTLGHIAKAVNLESVCGYIPEPGIQAIIYLSNGLHISTRAVYLRAGSTGQLFSWSQLSNPPLPHEQKRDLTLYASIWEMSLEKLLQYVRNNSPW